MIAIITIIISIIIDQITKIKAIGLKENPIPIIKGKLELVYVENRGAAFGMFQNKKLILVFLTLIIILAISVFLFKNYNRLSIVSIMSLSLIIGGAIGNLIDRIVRGYVVDFISYTFFNGYDFPVFNVADICVVSGCILMIISLFFTKDFEEI